MGDSFLKHYKAQITAMSPIHIGDGTTISKKEFIYNKEKNIVVIPDMAKFFGTLGQNEDAFVQYVKSRDANEDLGTWIRNHYIETPTGYTLYAGDCEEPKGICCFVKDAWGKPYVPGSSVKGMIRTALLVQALSEKGELRRKYKKKIDLALVNGRGNRRFFKDETEELEQDVFHTLMRGENVKRKNAVCSNMSGLIVSDSEPLGTDDLCLCQKIDLFKGGEESKLPILREALKPDTKILFDITIDSKIFPYTMNDILDALDNLNYTVYDNFYKVFGRGCETEGTVWLGGGVGFAAKTVIAALCGAGGDEDRLPEPDIAETTRLTAGIFEKTLSKNVYKKHKHGSDVDAYKVSPHVCKCTKYRGLLYDMGQGKIEIIG